MFCPKCGSKIAEGSAFCGSCGVKVATPSAGAPVADPATSTVNPAMVSANAAMPNAGNVAPAAQGAVPGAVGVGAPMVGAGAAVPGAVAPKKGKNPLLIVAAIAVIAIAAFCVYTFFFDSKPAYVVSSYVAYSDGEITQSLAYEHAPDGATTQFERTDSDGETTTTSYQLLGDGVSIPADASGRYEVNSDGDVTYIEYTMSDSSDEYKTICTYYKPGVLHTRKYVYPSFEQTMEYNEDGWLISRTTNFNSSSEEKYRYEYSFSNNGSVIQTVYSDQESSDPAKSRLVYNANGKISEVYKISSDGEESLTQTNDFQRIDHPGRYVAAWSRLKN